MDHTHPAPAQRQIGSLASGSPGAPLNPDAANVGQNSPLTRQAAKPGHAAAAGTSANTSASAATLTTIRPPVDIFEDAAGFTVVADMPGVSKEQLVVRVTGDNLVIEGTATVQAASDVELLYGEVSNPQYHRSFTLSRELDPSNIVAKLSNGVLHLTIPKAEAAKPRRITVNVG